MVLDVLVGPAWPTEKQAQEGTQEFGVGFGPTVKNKSRVETILLTAWWPQGAGGYIILYILYIIYYTVYIS